MDTATPKQVYQKAILVQPCQIYNAVYSLSHLPGSSKYFGVFPISSKKLEVSCLPEAQWSVLTRVAYCIQYESRAKIAQISTRTIRRYFVAVVGEETGRLALL